MFVSEISASFRVFPGQIALFCVFSGPTTSEIFAHGTREMTGNEQCLEIPFEFNRIPFLSKPSQTLQYRRRTLVHRMFVSEILASFRVFRGQIAL